jgi:hypothetical protein
MSVLMYFLVGLGGVLFGVNLALVFHKGYIYLCSICSDGFNKKYIMEEK